MQCKKEECKYYCFKKSEYCSEHCDNKLFDSSLNKKYINKNVIFENFNNLTSQYIINKNQQKNITNLIRSLNTNKFVDLIRIVITYLNCINKKYINADLGKYIFEYCNLNYKDKELHYLYSIVGDYWNIDSTHNSTALCYYGEWEFCENELLEEKILKNGPRKPKSIINRYCIYNTNNLSKIFEKLNCVNVK